MNPSPDLLLFLGRFHPLLVHLPIGMVVLLLVLEVLARSRRFSDANRSASYILAAIVPAAFLSAGCGWLLAGSGGYDEGILRVHRWLGVSTAALCAVTALCRWYRWERAYPACLCVAVLVLGVGSHFGAALTHGSDYLLRYAPGPVRKLLGGKTTAVNPTGGEPGHGSFRARILPILEANCGSCHNPEKHKGGLRMDSFDSLMRGGEDGPVVVPGDPTNSVLIQRLLLPIEHEDHMPPSGKPQPRKQEIEALRKWIEAGAPR